MHLQLEPIWEQTIPCAFHNTPITSSLQTCIRNAMVSDVSSNSYKLWHRWFGHLGKESMRRFKNEKLVGGMKVSFSNSEVVYETCSDLSCHLGVLDVQLAKYLKWSTQTLSGQSLLFLMRAINSWLLSRLIFLYFIMVFKLKSKSGTFI